MSPSETQSPKPKAKPQTRDKGKLPPVRVGRTIIPIYRLKRHGYQARYYVAGVPKRMTRASEDELRSEIEDIATGIENGRVQAGDLSAADVQSYYHALEELRTMGTDAPPLHVALREYAAATKLLPAGMSLVDGIKQLVRLQPADLRRKPVGTIIEELLLSLADNRASLRYTRAMKNDLEAWHDSLPADRTLDQVTYEDLRTYLRELKNIRGPLATRGQPVGPRRRDNVRDELVTLFRFARSNGYLPHDRETEAEQVKRIKPVHEIGYFTPEQLGAFLVYVDEHWLPWMVLGAFAGLRSSEIIGEPKDPNHERLKWTDIRWEAGSIIVPKTVAKKIKRPRRVPLRANLKAWLLPYRNRTGYIYPKVEKQTRETMRLEEVTGLEWVNNGLRHSYATHRMAEVGNAGQVAEEMGTSIGRIKANYDAVPADIDPKTYFGIMLEAPGSEEAKRKVLGMDGRPMSA